jgi:multiple antibiotic resistance protein
MSTLEITLLLFLVIDPFGNLPVVLTVLGHATPRQYRFRLIREMLLAFLILLLFAVAGEQILGYLNLQHATLSVAGGVILFLISLKMIFKSTVQMFGDSYNEDPILVPIAVPLLAGPSALTTVMILSTQKHVGLPSLVMALLCVFLATGLVLLLARRISAFLGPRGVRAMEKFMGLLLNLIAVNMILAGVKAFFLDC